MVAIKPSSTCRRLASTAAAAVWDTLTRRPSSCRAESCTAAAAAALPVLMSLWTPSTPARCTADAMPPAAVKRVHHRSDLASCRASLSARICRQPA